ncbi:threonylcarbamoyl-AMP synthase [Bacterioplanes sanyensis]|uniref:Threonylcarbamoyl-AMP synthase n=1 Tax=Bacterioplanes sanyensis TaxID=1249553 RepID=A0A222FGR7_9GAMM|nr:L-threonylcarbamoyladenylate synthase [Bacterioplanes sanyensis]ASP37940.1 threonylcarbamoyl-AMP synthase [Bacterioplanes sanyensis]
MADSHPSLQTLQLGTSDADIEQALAIWRRGGRVAIPTETVYGLAADASNAEAVNGIFAAKQRPANHPLIVHIGSGAQLRQWASEVPAMAQQLADAFWPGPLTLLLPKAESVPLEVTGGLPTVGIRVPSHPLLSKLLQAFGGGVAAPSANLYKSLSPTSAAQVLAGMDGRIEAVMDGGPCEWGLESTIVDVSGPQVRILRAGPITQAQIEQVLGQPVQMPQQHTAVVPGNVKAHYQPRTPLRLVTAEAQPQDDIGVLAHDGQWLQQFASQPQRLLPADAVGYGRELYAALHEMDQHGCRELWLLTPPQQPDWLAIHDRLKRATAQ